MEIFGDIWRHFWSTIDTFILTCYSSNDDRFDKYIHMIKIQFPLMK